MATRIACSPSDRIIYLNIPGDKKFMPDRILGNSKFGGAFTFADLLCCIVGGKITCALAKSLLYKPPS